MKMICLECGTELVPQKTVFKYMDHQMTHVVPRCPKCGKVFISAELAETKIADVEAELEDK
ncbi:MAG: YgiT-type zinc finger protein [Lachnospiraceae bacterium]|nr:YgiT-type zinc finger protein [Lachnospiraceae bacterium]MBR3165170.1 YgiT-type zinc finger protein [Lachnospiraceae bacterium]